MVQLKKKVTLKIKTPIQEPIENKIPQKEYETTKITKGSDSLKKSSDSESHRNNKTWIVLFAVCVLLIGGYFLLGNNDTNEAPIVDNEKPIITVETPSEKVGNTTEIGDSAKNEANTDTEEAQIAKTDNVKETEPQPSKSRVPQSQSKSDQTIKLKTVSNLSSANLEQKAIAVIRGDFGNGLERKQKLGDEYTSIQNRVNEMYRQGLVY